MPSTIAPEFERADTGVYVSVSDDRRFVVDELWPGVWWVFEDHGHHSKDGNRQWDHIGPDLASYDEALAWVAGYTANEEN